MDADERRLFFRNTKEEFFDRIYKINKIFEEKLKEGLRVAV
jgi:hypothetical protein